MKEPSPLSAIARATAGRSEPRQAVVMALLWQRRLLHDHEARARDVHAYTGVA